ncbi:PAS/PAC sensor signal transduction histidine kinase [Salinarchaeum sp. Harcht-Bsk1]|uniref:sensor histidine kinase n=1 Tax=Salinarchaeum sp. Harcht-Bsk1 TaxID=1333523 RepID=UPI0003423CB4|nr:ATP-binding protein [Salinarchaeum sp. Harcht-Bsk1]AGN02881.1 PAS/PAC sensor signal transduction histidine kinase [Salinarchaeum sp. Harcht-Bsk1]
MSHRPGIVGLIATEDGGVAEIETALTERGHEVRAATEVESARKLANERAVDCLVVAGGDGVDVVAVLSVINEADALLPTVCYPYAGSEALAARTIELDVDTYVPRSAGLESLVAAVDDACAAGDDPLRDAEGMLRTLTDAVPVSLSIYFKDAMGRHLHVSEHFPKLIGPPYMETPDEKIIHHPADALGMTDFDLYGPELGVETAADEERIMKTGEPIVDKLEDASESGDEDYYVSTTKAPWYDSTGRLRGIVGVTIDVSERERNRRTLARQNERLERFASTLSHDLRNPLAIAQGRLRELEGDSEAVADVEWALDRMDQLISEMLELARQGSVVDDPEPVDLALPARHAWDTVAAGGTLTVGDLRTVEGDPERIRTLFENLFRNAVEHGGDDVAIAVQDTADGFAVTDDGPGIPGDDPSEIFEHGFTTRADGTGFGLSIVREIADAHGWTIDATNGAAGGARFDVRVVHPPDGGGDE